MKPELLVPFTEYVRPRGRKRELLWMTDDKDIAAKARAIITNGFAFEIERLDGGIVSATVTHHEAGDMAHILSRNDKSLTAKITGMIRDFDIIKQTARVKEMLNDDQD